MFATLSCSIVASLRYVLCLYKCVGSNLIPDQDQEIKYWVSCHYIIIDITPCIISMNNAWDSYVQGGVAK